MKAIGNGGDGIQIINGASDNIIGGSVSEEKNTISGNTETGIAIFGSANNNKILGNYIGPDASGLSNIGNGGSGIYLGEGASGNIIGDNVSGSGNYITGSSGWAGIAIEGVGTDNNLVIGNFIGTNYKGEEGFGNRIGVRIYNGASDNRIGGEEAKDGNIIANSTEEGVVIYNDAGNTDPTTGNMILSNIIYSSGGLGIDLGGDGVTLNDEGDLDSSPNNFQNYPVFDSLSFTPGNVTAGGYLNSLPGATYTMQFFASKVGDNTSYGEGQTLLGTKSFTTDSEGNVSFVSTFPILNRDGQVITAIATDPDGNSSEFSKSIGGVKDHILADINKPFHYSINKDGIPKIYTEEDIEAIERAFQTWTDNSSAEIEFISDGTTDSCYASSGDGMNLVTFVDDRFPFAPGILAISAKTLKIDTLSMEAQILDADIVFNPAFLTSNQYSFDIADSPDDTMVFDIESVTAHEIGHVLGLIHSGAPLSTMFFMINTGTDSRSLEKDDIAWVNYRYPGSEYNSNYASIEGRVIYGDLGDPADPASHPPVAGALILAVDTLTKEQIHSYTDADGMYSVPLPANGTPVSYWIHVEPLDGDVFGTPLRPGNISSYIYSNTIYTDYRNEWYNGENESAYDNIDNVDTATVINVVAGETITGIDIITNKDDSRPYVLSVSPSATEYIDTVEVLSEIMIHFSEDVDLKTFTGESCFLTSGDDSFGGRYWMLGDNASVIFLTPENPLQYDTEYNLHLSEEITDLKSNPLYFENEIACTFKTCLPDTVRPFIKDIIPEPGSDSVFVLSEILVFFSEPMDPESAKEGFKLIDPMNQIVNGDFIWINVNQILTFIPERSLSESAEYYVTMTQGLEDHAGNPLKKDTTFVFTTVPDANPEILYLGPGDGSTNIRVETPVVVDFSEPVDINTIDHESFRLLQVGGGQVIGSFEFLMDNTRVVFRPENKLDFNTEYIIELSTAISDISIPAKTLISTVSSGFTTAEEPVLPYIQYIYPSAGVFGSVIMIHGSGFDPDPLNNSVVFCGKKAAILKSSLSDLAVKVPLGALSGDITVTVNGAISNAMYFDVLLQTTDPCEEVTANLNTGTRSRDVAITPDAGRALVTNPVTGTVSVVGLKLDNISIIETVAVGETPLKIDIDAKGKYAYVTNYTSHTVSVIDLDTYEVEHIKVGINPFGVVVSPEGKVYISNETSKDVSVIDVDPNSGGFNHVIANINTGTRNRDIDISPDAGIVLVTGDNGLTMINVNEGDINFNSVIANVNTGTRTRDIDITPEAGLAIVTTEAGDLFIVDIFPSSDAFGSVIANINTGTRSRDIEISPDAIFVYVTNAEGSLSVFKLDIGGVGGISTSYYRQVSLSLHSIIPAELIGANELEGIVIDYNAMKVYVVDPGNTGVSGQLIEITICCGPILPEKAIGNLIINIQNMLNSGLINAGNANALLTKLYNALNKVDKGQTKVAINILSALINQLEGLSETGQIPGDRADALIFAVNAIIFNIESTSFKSLDLKSLENTRGNVPGEGNFEKVFPNPFSEELSIYFTISSIDLQDVDVYIGIYNGAGQLVRILTDIPLMDGEYIVHWDGMLDNGNYAGDSAYFIYFRAGNYSDIKKVILQRRN